MLFTFKTIIRCPFTYSIKTPVILGRYVIVTALQVIIDGPFTFVYAAVALLREKP